MIYKYLLSLIILLCAFAAQANDLVIERGWVEDPSGKMTLSEIQQLQEMPLTAKLFSKGYSQSAFWLRLRIDPSQIKDTSAQHLAVRMRTPYQDQIGFLILSPLRTRYALRATTTIGPTMSIAR